MKNSYMNVKPFLDDNFLLENRMAEILYHAYAKEQPIIDYHNHLQPNQIAENKQFSNVTEVWLYGDHYKWRAMRTNGVNEHYITGSAADEEKFLKWATTVPSTIRNPLFHWTHLELQRYFGIQEVLSSKNAAQMYAQCTEQLQHPAYTTKGLLAKMNVEVVCTTDDPTDSLEYHQIYATNQSEMKMLPTFRPDKAILIGNENYLEYLQKLEKAADIEISDYEHLIAALQKRVHYFKANGCCISDHGLNKVFSRPFTPSEMQRIFTKRLNRQTLSQEEIETFISGIMHDLGIMYAEQNWVMQLHLGALRNNSSRMMRQLGPDTGFDSIGDYPQAQDLAAFFESLDDIDKLPKTIIYNLNPSDNEVMATMIGNFNDGSVRGKIQYGSGWWFLDQKDGMEKQLNALSNMGLLSCFVGMLTDSRSFLSFPRHEYFRRILCNLIGKDVHNGELPNDEVWLGGIVQDICYRNAKQYFEF